MPLRGDLREFGVPEIFQLLEQQAKTGCLNVKTDVKELEVYFREGRIVGAFPAGTDPWDHLAGILFRVGYLSEEDVRRLNKRQANDLTSLKEILRGETLLGPREIDVLLREHIEELLFPMFQKRRGEFFFIQDKTLQSDWELREPLAPEPLVLEGLRKSDEWPLLKKRIGSFQEVPQRQLAFRGSGRLSLKKRVRGLWHTVRGAEEEDVSDWPEEDSLLEGEPTLSSAEKAVYSLTDGRRNIEEIIHASLLGEFSACQAFLSLMDRGWIRFAEPETTSRGAGVAPVVAKEKERANLIRGSRRPDRCGGSAPDHPTRVPGPGREAVECRSDRSGRGPGLPSPQPCSSGTVSCTPWMFIEKSRAGTPNNSRSSSRKGSSVEMTSRSGARTVSPMWPDRTADSSC